MSATETTLRVMREAVDAINADDRIRFNATAAPRAVHKDLTLHQVFVSPEAISEWTWHWREAFPDLQFSVTDISAHEHSGVIEGIWVGTHTRDLITPVITLPATGKAVSVPAVMTVLTDDSKIAKSTHYFDLFTLLFQLGRAQLGRLRAAVSQGQHTARSRPGV